ncbi:MAG: PilT protein-like protein [uncultured bacterium]|uniref:PIN domain-containing protein n=1 Tax=Candidatus Woesebacteria bacterium RIFCSPHIGHO2_12_FULL_41_24 TaxID=1802510 RepID=A0A1F8AUD7_9BACT|nr:MAG: PilT protein-like protein [uncultured bacterium]OGM14349.1 MAG: hypothetical protein A2W15_02260 [Candidatus Woesebacteria bacterium RBG_16_41_13]OGM30460.1 MAG: hypothetical protein A2873_02020 [Candidatus Woesebacteria bacterium RIFCSPHIGHO2_01_FULL_42_80]OGM34212.1 MAG: hypothetical protein A3D84_04340 [Candidatus Woesebacteria bacterium RIFCSPHIGHO2_02_FULL_42_20]OGM55331.1 MAG: hypothetical protein A3E44_03555 [Candidatus Woesebacteria bacterium RIFCSPHIGHO2_12_FULL_41_24]OGM68031
MSQILLDTNSYSFFIKGDRSVTKEIYNSEFVYLSIISVGELYAGFQRGSKFSENVGILVRFLGKERMGVLKISIETAKIYGRITNELYKKGTPIPTNDVWIAAQAIETASVLVTHDSHFLEIPKLKIWKRALRLTFV